MNKEEKKIKSSKMIELMNNTIINGKFLKKGTVIELTAEIKKLLQPFGYTFITKS